jgi:hypothetical protein
MKYLFGFILLLPLLSKSQTVIPTKDGKVTFEEVVSIPDSSKGDQLYRKALLWTSKYYSNSEKVTDLKDPATNTIVLKPMFEMKMPLYNNNPNGFTTYNLTLKFKDGAYKYVLDQVLWDDLRGDKVQFESLTKSNNVQEKTRVIFLQEVNSILENLKTFMRTKETSW